MLQEDGSLYLKDRTSYLKDGNYISKVIFLIKSRITSLNMIINYYQKFHIDSSYTILYVKDGTFHPKDRTSHNRRWNLTKQKMVLLLEIR